MIFWVHLVFWFSKRFLRRGPLHGYGIVLHIQRASDELLRVEEGSFYPALPPHGTEWMDQLGMGTHRDEQKGEVLQADCRREEGVARNRKEL
jgi:Transcriptional regulator PadR-like family